jgi:pectinesterase
MSKWYSQPMVGRTFSQGGPWMTVFVGVVCASALLGSTVARATDYYVDPTGQGGLGDGTRTYLTVQAALTAVPAGTSTAPTCVLVAPGTYNEQVTLSNKAFVDLIGTGTSAAQTVLTYNLTTSIGNASVTINANHFTASNLTFANSTPNGSNGHPTVQALALAVQGDENAFRNCRVTGFQDTLYAAGGRDYFNNCYISDITDFMYGSATAVFDSCTIFTPVGKGHVTAVNTAPKTPIGFVIMNSTITGDSSNSTDLGRPWQYGTGAYPNAIYLNDKFGPQVTTGLFEPWDTANTNPAGDTRYAEYGQTDLNGVPLDTSKFVSWSHVLSAADASKLNLANIFGPSSNWDFSHWGVGNSTIWGPVNAAGTSNVTT